MSEDLSPADFKTKVEELQTLITEKLSELEDNPRWGNAEEREELGQALDELAVQIEAMRDLLEAVD
jgi:hypothetical protein